MTNKRKLYQTFLMTLVMMLLFPLTAVAESVGYAVFNSESGTLTFKYGEKPEAGTNETVYDLNKASENPENRVEPGWLSNTASLTKVVFDSSFSSARPNTCYKWFDFCLQLNSIEGIEYLNTSEVTDMSYMFYYCHILTSLDLSKFDTSKVTDMSNMFFYCQNLTSLDLSNFNTSNVENMEHMFTVCECLTSLDVSKFNTAKVTNMQEMFNSCTKLTSLDLTNFNTSNVKNMESMFNSCIKLTSLDLTNFNTSNVTNMDYMFHHCPSLATIYVSDKFTTDKVQSSDNMFTASPKLVGAIACDGNNNIDVTYANCHSGYFTYGINSKEDLVAFAKKVNGTYTPAEGKTATAYPNMCGVLMQDITLTAEDNIEPIGSSNYTGTFDGRGHYISGLNFSGTNNNLFAQSGGTIKNLSVVNATIAKGSNGCVCHNNSGTIENCIFMGTTEGTTTPNGAVCLTNSGTITNCYYLASYDDGNGGKTAGQLNGGEVTYQLNESSPYGKWGQQIGKDNCPVLGSPYKVVRTAQDGDKAVYWATFSNLNSNAELSAPEGNITAYDATVSAGKLTLTGRSVQVAAGEGVLLRAECEYVNAKNIDDIAHLQFSPAMDVFASETLDITIAPVGQVQSAWYKVGEDGKETAFTGEASIIIGEGMENGSSINVYYGLTNALGEVITGVKTYTKQNSITIYMKGTIAPNIYAWINDESNNSVSLTGSWPGAFMTESTTINGENFWYYTFSGYSSINYVLKNNNAQSYTFTANGDRYHNERTYDITDEMNLSESTQSTVLVATPETAETVTAETGYTLYRLTYNKTATKEGLGFYLGVVGDSKDGSKLAATPGKAYLKVLTSEAAEPSTAKLARGFAFPGDDETTGIECITVTDESLHRNGNAEGIFDLQGRKVSKPTKGVYIKNNRVVFKLKN